MRINSHPNYPDISFSDEMRREKLLQSSYQKKLRRTTNDVARYKLLWHIRMGELRVHCLITLYHSAETPVMLAHKSMCYIERVLIPQEFHSYIKPKKQTA